MGLGIWGRLPARPLPVRRMSESGKFWPASATAFLCLRQTGPSGETKHGAEFEWLELWGLCAINGFFSIITSAGLEYEVKEYFPMRLNP